MKILSIDPALNNLGWAVLAYENNSPIYIASGAIRTPQKEVLNMKLKHIHEKLKEVILSHQPSELAIEETFVNKNPLSSLKLGQARGAILLTAMQEGLEIFEYSATNIKKSITSNGRAEKAQVQHMVKILLPKAQPKTADEADALAIGLCHLFRQFSQVR